MDAEASRCARPSSSAAGRRGTACSTPAWRSWRTAATTRSPSPRCASGPGSRRRRSTPGRPARTRSSSPSTSTASAGCARSRRSSTTSARWAGLAPADLVRAAVAEMVGISLRHQRFLRAVVLISAAHAEVRRRGSALQPGAGGTASPRRAAAPRTRSARRPGGRRPRRASARSSPTSMIRVAYGAGLRHPRSGRRRRLRRRPGRDGGALPAGSAGSLTGGLPRAIALVQPEAGQQVAHEQPEVDVGVDRRGPVPARRGSVNVLDSSVSAVTSSGGLSPCGHTPPSTIQSGRLVKCSRSSARAGRYPDVLLQLGDRVRAAPVGLERELMDAQARHDPARTRRPPGRCPGCTRRRRRGRTRRSTRA